MDVAVAKCYADKIRLKARPIITGDAYSEQRTPTPKRVESHQSRTEAQERYEGKKSETPSGFHDLLQKVVRAVVLARPAHLYRFIADVLEAELTERTLNDIVSRCALMKSRKLEPTESCSLLTSFVNQTRLEIYGEEQFTMGPIPDYELQKPALDRYRDYAGISPFDMSFELPCDVAPTAAEQQESPPEVECPRPEPEKPPPPPREPERIRFDRGPVPEYQLGEPALDRYRDYAGIGPFELDECVPHTSLCRCLFCSMKEGRRLPTSLLEEEKPCDRRFVDEDHLKVFVDSPVYREAKVRDEEAYKQGGISSTEPFGQLFQGEKQFEYDVFEPEYPDPFCEKSFMQLHPLFGDFGVKVPKRPGVEIDVDDQLVESPESAEPYLQFDPDPRDKQLVESPEFAHLQSQEDPNDDDELAELDPGQDSASAIQDRFDDINFDSQPEQEQPQTFGSQAFEGTENPQETAEEGASQTGGSVKDLQTTEQEQEAADEEAPEAGEAKEEAKPEAEAETQPPDEEAVDDHLDES